MYQFYQGALGFDFVVVFLSFLLLIFLYIHNNIYTMYFVYMYYIYIIYIHKNNIYVYTDIYTH